MRARQLTLALIAAAATVAGVAGAAHAEPYMAVRTGAKCSDCHVNQTGGGKRTPFAYIHAHDILKDVDVLPIPAGVKAFNGQFNAWFSLGADLRVRNTTTFRDRRSRSTGRVPENRAFREHVTSNEFDVQEFLLYGQVDLWPDVVTLYVDEDLNGGANNREAFGLIRGFLPWGTYVKAGRMFPAYGLRVWDDEAFIRARTGFTFDTYDEGAEVGFQPGPFFLASTVTNGQEGDKDAQWTVNGYGVFDELPVVRNVLAGASYARQSDKRWSAAFYGGSNFWRFTYLGEFDLIDDRTPASVGRRDQYAAYAELNFLVLSWLNLRGTFDFVKVSNDNDQVRYAIGAEPFVNRVIQPRIQYRINNGPSRQPELNQDELLLELHFFL